MIISSTAGLPASFKGVESRKWEALHHHPSLYRLGGTNVFLNSYLHFNCEES